MRRNPAPRERERKIRWMHGTASVRAAAAVVSSGLIEPQTRPGRATRTTPLPGHIYLTQLTGVALTYATGQLWYPGAGDFSRSTGEGYIFTVDGAALRELVPDEDAIGQYAYEASFGRVPKIQELDAAVAKVFAKAGARLREDFRGGVQSAQAAVGKKVLPLLRPAVLWQIVDSSMNIAHQGSLPFASARAVDVGAVSRAATAELEPQAYTHRVVEASQTYRENAEDVSEYLWGLVMKHSYDLTKALL